MAVGVALREDERVPRLDGMERCEQVLQNDHVDEAYSEKVNTSLEKEEPGLGSSSLCFEGLRLEKVRNKEDATAAKL